MRFSQRHGHAPKPSPLRQDEISSELRNALWNTFLREFGRFFRQDDLPALTGDAWTREGREFCLLLFDDFLRMPVDTISLDPGLALGGLREQYFSAEWYWVYDLIEWLSQYASPQWETRVNSALQRELAPYRLIAGVATPITTEEEIQCVEQATTETASPVSRHVRQALLCMSDRQNPDFRNSIKESISAVEAAVREATGQSKATLGDALKRLDLHPALKQAFLKLYGYTSDEDGIRHALSDSELTLTVDDARYFLVSCSAFANYLTTKFSVTT